MTLETTLRGRGGIAAAFGLALALVLSTTGRADAATLRWKFKSGETLHYQMEQNTVTQMKANGQDIKTTNKQTIDMSWKIDSVAADGTAEISQTIDRMQTKIDSNFGTFDYDSKSDKVPEGPLAAGIVPTLKLLVGATFKYKMSPRGELTDVRLPEGLLKSLKEATPNSGAVGMFSEDGLKNMINESSLALPEEDIVKGKIWSRQTKMPPSAIGTLTFDKTYTYDGPGDGGETLGLTAKLALEPAANGGVDIKLTDQSGKGSFVFDNTAGRVAKSKVTEKIDMVITVQNQTINQSTETTSEMKLVDVK